ncbi:CAZyme family GH3, partial [Penicillium verhagenii]
TTTPHQARILKKMTTRKGYESLEPNNPDEHLLATDSDDDFHNVHASKLIGTRNDTADTPLSSDDEYSIEDEANLKLLPLQPKDTSKLRRDRRTSVNRRISTSDSEIDGDVAAAANDDPHNVHERIELMLQKDQRERNALSESFNLDFDDDESLLALSDVDSEGFPADKLPYTDDGYVEGNANLKTKIQAIQAVVRQRPWWQICGMLFVGVGVMWLSAVGLRRWLYKSVVAEFDPVPWYPTPLGGTNAAWQESYGKAQELVQQMTLLEKVNVTTGTGWMMGLCVGNTGPAAHVNFPSLCLQDGPLGLRFADNITAFPAGITTGATWNRELMRARGVALGREARLKGVNVLLGVAAAETIRGIQRNGVMATAKHFVMNEQEHFRQPFEWGIPTAMSSNIDDRALHEVFVWPFAESVRADVASVMCAYQMVNNSHACENSKLLNGILKDELGFQGFVQSDWLAQRSGVQSALSGLDMSMPGDGLHWQDGDSLWGPHLTRAALNTSVPMERLNDMVTRIAAAYYHFRQDTWESSPVAGKIGPNFSSWTHEKNGSLHPGSPDDHTNEVVNYYVNAQGKSPHSNGNVARKIAAEGTVLLKNVEGTLPLSRTVSRTSGKYRVGIYGEDAGPGQGPNFCADRGCNQGTLASGWGSGAVNFPYLVNPWDALKSAWSSETVDVRAYLTNNVAVDDLVEQDLCLVFANADGGEGFIKVDGVNGDRSDLFLQRNGTALIEGVARNCGGGHGKTVVVVHSIGPVILDHWIDLPGVAAVLYANLPGQESGNALVDVLFGDVDASGRLPYTIGHSLEDYGPGAQILYESSEAVPQVYLTQGLYVDYRYFDKFNVTPHFEFGFGLSYTTFKFSSLQIEKLQEKSRLPEKRPSNAIDPPVYEDSPESSTLSLFPPDFNILGKYIYPYLKSREGTKPGSYPYPEGYYKSQKPSAAGGGPGGNPSLYEPMLELTVELTNTGARAGQEVVQIYVSFPADVVESRGLGRTPEPIEFPDRVLRNFQKVLLEPNETRIVNMTLTRKDLSYWSVRAQNWVLPTENSFRIWAGRSSRDLPLVAEF